MNETGGKLGAAYSALPREEPSAAVDAAILAASRRALARPSLSRRFAAPVSIAAVLVLAFGVTLHMQQEKPGIESPDVSAAPPAAPPPAQPVSPPVAEHFAEAASSAKPAEAAAPVRKDAAPERKLAPKVKQDTQAMRAALPAPMESNIAPPPQAKLQSAPAPQAAEAERDRAFRDEARASGERKELAASADAKLRKEAAANVAQAPAPAVAPMARMKRENAPTAAPAAAADAAAPVDEPTRELEAIAKLRAEQRHEEADKALAEFRRKRPDYRIPDAMWERVRAR